MGQAASSSSAAGAAPGARASASALRAGAPTPNAPTGSKRAPSTPPGGDKGADPNSITDKHVETELQRMARRPPLHCIFYYESQVKSGEIQMPLLYEKTSPEQTGTRLMDLELWLREQFSVPVGSSVFAVVPADELYSPPYPFVMINTIAGRLYQRFETERVPVLQFALVVRDMARLHQPILRSDAYESPYFPISARALGRDTDCIERKMARMRFVENMKTWGFVRLEVTREQAQLPTDVFRAVRVWLADQLALPANQRWRDFVDATDRSSIDTAAVDGNAPAATATASVTLTDASASALHTTHPAVSKGRYVGFSADRNREYLQLRRPVAASGTPWPPTYFADNEAFAMQLLQVLDLLDGIARDCMRAVCEILNLDERWVLDELLDDVTPAPATATSPRDKTHQYGPSVLRVYNYRNKATSAAALHPDDHSCGVHADLGLVTVSPVATVPGLQMWNLERMTWSDVEEDADTIHFSVFAGETLGFLTNGLIKAPLHRVPAICVDAETNRRMSMPYFLRVRPECVLNPRADSAVQITCRDFMEDLVFKVRPWRREDHKKNAPPPDY